MKRWLPWTLGVLGVVAVTAVLFHRSKYELPRVDESLASGGDDRALAVTDPVALMALERRGFSLAARFGADGEDNEALAATPRFRSLIHVLEQDLRELDARPRIAKDPESPNHPFDLTWLASARAHFELVGVVHRPDRAFVEPGSCGEVRLVYRLALTPSERPTTRLPMTVSLIDVVRPGDGGCAATARGWLGLPPTGASLVEGIARLVERAGPFAKLEIDLQNLHGPSRRLDEDDHAEYLLRSFDATKDALVPRRLFDTPRDDLSGEDRAALLTWIAGNFDAIDRGEHVLPDRFLAERVVSFAPRGLARPKNRPFVRLFGGDEGATRVLASLPYANAHLVRSPRALLRRLDQGTCAGCHESRSIAGFHLLGEERDPDRAFNALALGRSVHALEEVPWRRRFLDATSRGAAFSEPRPFADHGAPGGRHSRCGLGDTGFSAFGCDPGDVCKDLVHEDLGTCEPAGAPTLGASCESARVADVGDVDGDRIEAFPKEACVVDGKPDLDACSPNAFGFTGGLCSAPCEAVGEVKGDTICADLPASGYETDCFPKPIAIEECLKTHSARRRVAWCDATHLCRDDFACARVPGAPKGIGACVPPYFVFQARVDGPILDR